MNCAVLLKSNRMFFICAYPVNKVGTFACAIRDTSINWQFHDSAGTERITHGGLIKQYHEQHP
jgi:hypothetical protein